MEKIRFQIIILLCGFLLAIYLIHTRLNSFIDLSEVWEFRTKNISTIDLEEITSKDFRYFINHIEIKKLNNSIEYNLKLLFQGYKKKQSCMIISTYSYEILTKLNAATEEASIYKYANEIGSDPFSIQWYHTSAIAKAAEIAIKNGQLQLAYQYLLLGFTKDKTPLINTFNYYFLNLLKPSESFIYLTNDLDKLEKIEKLLLECKNASELNFEKNSDIAYFKLGLYLFDYLIFYCRIKQGQIDLSLKEKVIKKIEKLLKINFILEICDNYYLCPLTPFYYQSVISFIESNCTGKPPDCKTIDMPFKKKNTLITFINFLLHGKEISLYAPKNSLNNTLH